MESLRRLSFSIEPTPTLDALGLLVSAAPAVAGRVALIDARLVRAVARALEPHEPALARVSTLSRWLCQHDHARITPVLAVRRGVTPPWHARVEVTLHLRALAKGMALEGRRIDGTHHTALYAARALLQASAAGPLWVITSLRSGTHELTTAEALRTLDALARDSALCDGAIPRRFDPNRPGRVARGPTPVAPPPAVEAPPTPVAPHVHPRATRARVEAPPSPQGAFGGLPDDATSALPPTPQPEPKSDRALGLDAEFFLETAGVHTWPCAQPTLYAARRRVIARLHPDHAGDHAGRDFHRALKGFAELLPQCIQEAAGPSPASTAAAAPAKAPPPLRYQEWPPPTGYASPSPTPVPVATPRTPRRAATHSR